MLLSSQTHSYWVQLSLCPSNIHQKRLQANKNSCEDQKNYFVRNLSRSLHFCAWYNPLYSTVSCKMTVVLSLVHNVQECWDWECADYRHGWQKWAINLKILHNKSESDSTVTCLLPNSCPGHLSWIVIEPPIIGSDRGIARLQQRETGLLVAHHTGWRGDKKHRSRLFWKRPSLPLDDRMITK